MSARNTFLLLALVPFLVSFLGCVRHEEPAGPVVETRVVVVTNFVESVREVAVTNVVNVTVTNVVVERREPARILSSRKTAPYIVSAKSFDAAQLRKLASDSAARVIECDIGAVALVEASDKAVGLLSGVARVSPLGVTDKIAVDAGENVRILPLSSIDSAPVAKAVRDLGGEIVQVTTEGRPAIRAKLSYTSIRKLAERGDVRRIERDGK